MTMPGEPLKREIKELIISALRIPDVTPDDIKDEAPLFGDGLGLDSVDALELFMVLQKKYGVRIDDQNLARAVMQSINTIAEFVAVQQSKMSQEERAAT